jgi:hypothetical protein
MAVIINEFEVIPDTSDTPEETTAETSSPPERGTQLTPMDMYDVLQYQMNRMLRTWAH